MSDVPIDPRNHLSGVNVLDIGDARVARGQSRRPTSVCPHLKLVYDPHERRVWCQDCESDVEPFDAFRILVEQMDAAYKHLDSRRRKVAEAERRTLITRAAKAMDQEWRRKLTVPCCPHCAHALLPEDMTGRLPKVSKELARAAAQKAKR